MAWRHLAVGAAGVATAVALGTHGAAADDSGSTDAGGGTNKPAAAAPSTTTTRRSDSGPSSDTERLQQAAALNAIAQAMPPPDPNHKPTPRDPIVTGVPVSNVAVLSVEASDPSRTDSRSAIVAKAAQAFERALRVPSRRAAKAVTPAAPRSDATVPAPVPAPAPTDDTSGPKSSSSAGPIGSATTTTSTTNTATPALPPSLDPVTTPQGWWPADVGDRVDQQIAQAWRGTPVRGPPPGVASALGNDGRTTISQVSVVSGRDGFEVSISTQQVAAVTNAGVASADAYGAGSASSTGDLARTSITQVSVVVQRGTGTADVVQNASVENLGVGVAASAGPASAKAVGNASSTHVNQIAVVLILGSGDATLHQTTGVTNVGGATAVAIDRSATATGSTAATDVNQIAVLIVHDDDVTLNQSTTTVNVGVADAEGGNATGNSASTSVGQTTVWR